MIVELKCTHVTLRFPLTEEEAQHWTNDELREQLAANDANGEWFTPIDYLMPCPDCDGTGGTGAEPCGTCDGATDILCSAPVEDIPEGAEILGGQGCTREDLISNALAMADEIRAEYAPQEYQLIAGKGD